MTTFLPVLLRADGLDFLYALWIGGMVVCAIGAVIALLSKEWKVAGKLVLGIFIVMLFPLAICGAIALGVGKQSNGRR